MRIYLFEWFRDKKDGKKKFCIIGVQFRSECIFRISLELKCNFPMTWMVGDDI